MHRCLAFAVTVLLALPHAARAHDRWADGEAVPAWVKRQCCGAMDAHHLRSDQVHPTADGYQLDGYKAIVPENQRLPSPDGSWWVFYRDYGDGTQSPVYCLFGPVQGS